MYNSTNLPLERKKIIKKTLEKSPLFVLLIILGCLLIGFNPFYLDAQFLLILGLALPVLPICGVYIYQGYYYDLYFYDFKDEGAEIRKGVISQSTGHVYYARIQNIFIDQDIGDRIFGLYDVHYETAAESSGTESSLSIPGLTKPGAEKIKNFLLAKADNFKNSL